MNIGKGQRPALFLRHMEKTSENFTEEALCQAHSESSHFPCFSMSCTTQYKEKQKCINKHVARSQSCCHAEKDSFLDIIKCTR